MAVFRGGQVFEFWPRPARRWPESLLVSTLSSVGGLLGKKWRHGSVRAAIGILNQALVDLLRKRHPVGRHVASRFGIRKVKEQEIYEVDGEAPEELQKALQKHLGRKTPA